MSLAARFGACVIGAALFLVSCAGTRPPIDSYPELGRPLSRLDDAVSAGHYHQARLALADLRGLANKGRASGVLTEEQADQILTATSSLAKDMRNLQPSDVTHAPEPSPTPSNGEVDPGGQGDESGHGHGHGHDDESPGNSENAPGHNKDD